MSKQATKMPLSRKLLRLLAAVVIGVLFVATLLPASGQYYTPTITPPPASTLPQVSDSAEYPNVRHTVPVSYEDLMGSTSSVDLRNPENVTTQAEYDPATGCYVIRTKIGDYDISTPFMLTEEQYNNWQLRQSLQQYYRERNLALVTDKEKSAFNILDMNFALGPLEKIFGPGGVQLKTQGSIQINMGVKSNFTDNPSLSVNSRRKTYFDFDQRIQATINASVGDRMHFNMTYNTDATFDFDSKNLRLNYEGKEDDIVQSIEAGNVSMTTGSSLIQGSAALFGIKSKLQFGRLTVTSLISQQNSESQTVNAKGGAQTTKFTVNVDQYDQNRHYFLSHFFRDHYDEFASKLPYVSSGVSITRIEVWVTNKSGKYEQARNLVALQDLGENRRLSNDYWQPNLAMDNPANMSNNELSTLKEQYPDARYINNVTQALEPLSAFGFGGGADYEKVESARLLSSSEYTLNSTLGYISLKSALNADEVLAVAFEYTYHGQVYQVGEFSSDVAQTDQSLYVKMLKSTTVNTAEPMWDLMMKNVYSLGAYQVQKSKFKLNIKYLSDTTGTEIYYLPTPSLNTKSLLQVMNLDRIDSNNESNPDGIFDFIEGYTIIPAQGKVIFPVVEPFGEHLRRQIGNDIEAERFVYQELYDSTLVVARQFADKNKFVLSGEYQASNGSQIRLNAMNVPRGSVVVTAGGVTLVENSDYTVDYAMGIVTITNQSIIDSGQSVSVRLENQSLFSMQRKTLVGFDVQYQFNRDLNIGATFMHFSEKALTEKVSIGDETVNNSIFGFNLSYNKEFMWLTNLLNLIPTVNATQPSRISLTAEYAQLVPASQKSGSARGSSYVDDFESTQTGIDLRSPYAWYLASTPYDTSDDALFPEASLSNDVRYGYNRALLNWYFIDRMFTSRNSSLAPGYIKSDLSQLSHPYVREVTSYEIFPGRELSYGESSTVQTLNLSFYPEERGPYNLDADRIDSEGKLLFPEKRWGGIMRKMDNTNFEQSNIEYLEFWMMSPFLDPNNPNTEGGDMYINFGEISEDILKDGFKSYENGVPADGSNTNMQETNWGRVSTQNSLTYSFDNASGARLRQDVGLNGLSTEDEFNHQSYSDFLNRLRQVLSPATIEQMELDPYSPLNDPASDNYHFYRGYDYDEQRVNILDRYKRYNGLEGNSLSPDDVNDELYQTSRATPDVEDINQDNTLNEYERYFQYRVSIRPEDFVVGRNYITNKQVSVVHARNDSNITVEWYQFKIPLKDYEKVVGNIKDFSTIRFARMFLTGFRHPVHIRFATLELVRGEWRPYDFNLNTRGDAPAEGSLDVSVVNIEENAAREPVNYVLPPGVTRITDPGQSQIVQLNEQSMSLKVTGLQAGDARGVYRNTQQDLRNYKRLQMWTHAEQLIDDVTSLRSGDLSVFIRLGSDVKNNYYEYEIPLTLTPEGHYSDSPSDRARVWPMDNFLDLNLQNFVDLKLQRNTAKRNEEAGVGYQIRYSQRDPDNERNTITVMGNPTLSDVRVLLIGVRNNSATVKDGVVWVNELKVTDFNQDGGWAGKANVTLNMSDIATINAGAHVETAGFGAVDQGLNSRRMDDYEQYNFAVQADLGRFLPEAVHLRAPIYYSMSRETITPRYNPLDQDVLLDDALDACSTKAERDSIESYAVERTTQRNFSISGLNFGVRSKNPMPWDPANFTFNFSFSKQTKSEPSIEYEYTNDYRGSFQYSYSPMIRGLKPLGWLKTKNKNLKFFKDLEIQWLPNSIQFLTNMSRYYFEQQMRSENDVMFQLPVSVSKNFLWDRQLNVSWNLTKNLQFTFASNTSARIEEPVGAVNKKLFPDEYREWKEKVWDSILSFGTPWNYNQTFTAQYTAPFNKIPVLDFLTGKVSYNGTYRWDRGATIDGQSLGNTIANQGAWNWNARINFESLYNKIPICKEVTKRFANTTQRPNQRQGNQQSNQRQRQRKFERSYKLPADSAQLIIKHNLRTKKVKVTCTEQNGQAAQIDFKVVDENSIEVLTHGDRTIKFVITESTEQEKKSIWTDVGQYALRFLISPRNISLKIRNTHTASLPLFIPEIGDIFGQTNNYGPMAPGLGFAFGFEGESYLQKALDRGWLMTDDGQTSPAVFSRTKEINLEANFEFFKGFKVQLTWNRTDNRTSQVQFMYDSAPTTYSGTFTMTACAIGTALKGSSADDGYASDAFSNFLDYIPQVRDRVEQQYLGTTYPDAGFISGTAQAGLPFDPEVGAVPATSPDVLIPAFMAAYTGSKPSKQWLSPFPSFSAVRPNWRITYDGFINMGNMREIFKTFTVTHAYQCTYSVGSYSSYLNWVSLDGGTDRGFTLDEQTQRPVPSSPFNISSVTLTEKFAPLIGVNFTLKNELQFSAEYRDQRTLTLNSSAGQIVEASTKGLKFGMGYKIVNFNTVLKMRGSQRGVSNDLTLNAEIGVQNNKSLIRKIAENYSQPTSGSNTWNINFTASYVMSKNVTLSAYFDHQVNKPIVTTSSYPTTNSSYGISLNINLAR